MIFISIFVITTGSRVQSWYRSIEHFSPPSGLGCCPFLGGGSVVDSSVNTPFV